MPDTNTSQAQSEAHPLTDSPWAQTLTACLIMENAVDAIRFCKKAFEAKELVRIGIETRGTVGHAELRIGTSSVMLAEEFPDMETPRVPIQWIAPRSDFTSTSQTSMLRLKK